MTNQELIKQLRSHVKSRLDITGKPYIENGSWTLMLKAADALENVNNEIKSRIENAKEHLNESKSDIRTPGFNQDLGYSDALGELLEWINENDV